MLLFSTVLDTKDSFAAEAFIRLVLEWNETSTRSENIVTGIEWHGERTIRYGSPELSLEFAEYAEKQIIAARHEKVTADGITWDSNFVLDYANHQISIQLDRTYSEDGLVIDGAFNTPHFITMLINHGALKDDHDLPVLRDPIYVTDANLDLCKQALIEDSQYKLPVIYVSKTAENEDPLSVDWLSSRLKGAAHVLVEQSVESCTAIRAFCGKSQEPFGAVWIFYPSDAVRCKKYYYHSPNGNEELRLEKIIRNVIQYSIAQRTDHLLTWNGVKGAILTNQLRHQISVYAKAEHARKEAENEIEKVYETFDEELQSLQQKVEELTAVNESLHYELQGLRAKYAKTDTPPLLYLGDEDDFYPGEIRDMILRVISDALSNADKDTREADVLADILRNNPYQHLSDDRRQEVKTILKGYKNLSSTMRRALQALGIEITEDGKHYKLTYRGDQRYLVTIAKTPSDGRSGSNSAAQIGRVMF